MRVLQEAACEGGDIVVRLYELPKKELISTRTYEDAAKYFVGQLGTASGRVMVLHFPESMMIDIEPEVKL